MKYFNLFSNVLPVKGFTRMLICDLQRNVSEIYPLDLYNIVEELKNNSIEDVLRKYDEESKEIFQEYLQILEEKEYGFITENDWDKNFIPMSYNYQDSTQISNLIVEFDSIDILIKLKESIEKLFITHLVIFSEKNLSKDEIKEIDECYKESCLEGIELYLPYNENVNEDFFKSIHQNTLRIYSLIFYNCNNTELQKNEKKYRFNLEFISKILHIKSCGKVDIKYFGTNITKVIEAINYNSCLYKKVSIDKNGDIRNCPSMCKVYGNIKETNIEEVINDSEFKKYWNLTKDQIEVCKDCEFRYICTDCRAYTEQTHIIDNNLDISKPLKCGYDPYIGEWKEWSTSPLKQDAIKFYGTREILQN